MDHTLCRHLLMSQVKAYANNTADESDTTGIRNAFHHLIFVVVPVPLEVPNADEGDTKEDSVNVFGVTGFDVNVAVVMTGPAAPGLV